MVGVIGVRGVVRRAAGREAGAEGAEGGERRGGNVRLRGGGGAVRVRRGRLEEGVVGVQQRDGEGGGGAGDDVRPAV